MSTTTPIPTSWRAGTSSARSRSRHCCASAGPRAGQAFRPPRAGRSRTEASGECRGHDGDRPRSGDRLVRAVRGLFCTRRHRSGGLRGRSVPMDMVLGRERTQQSQVVKQADVVALLGLLPEEFPGAAGAANFDYYEPRCGHGSSLSPAMHGLVAAGWVIRNWHCDTSGRLQR